VRLDSGRSHGPRCGVNGCTLCQTEPFYRLNPPANDQVVLCTVEEDAAATSGRCRTQHTRTHHRWHRAPRKHDHPRLCASSRRLPTLPRGLYEETRVHNYF
jgi:hypothetical protein